VPGEAQLGGAQGLALHISGLGQGLGADRLGGVSHTHCAERERKEEGNLGAALHGGCCFRLWVVEGCGVGCMMGVIAVFDFMVCSTAVFCLALESRPTVPVGRHWPLMDLYARNNNLSCIKGLFQGVWRAAQRQYTGAGPHLVWAIGGEGSMWWLGCFGRITLQALD